MKCKRLITKQCLWSLCGINEEDYGQIGVHNPYLLCENDTCFLDPGGMASVRAPVQHIAIGEFKFDVMVDKASGMASLVKNARECGPYSIFNSLYGKVAMPTIIIEQLYESLQEIAMSDIALNTQLDTDAAIQNMVDEGIVVRQKKSNVGR
jgi:hypothetical protein